ncbi:hypothetical protein evm_012745 [Chilo suppressalis]|nr:hypothetical protein evm_012745 [Chilo suppressalis]
MDVDIFIFIFTVLNLNIVNIYGYRVFDRDGVVTILAFENEKVNIQCQTDMPMTYCGFIHPSGKRYSFSGQGLNNGHCAVSVKATKQDSGQWSCHVGRESVGVDIMQTIHLRVVNQVAAIQPNVTAVHGKPVTLECATVKGMISLKYCRFEPPNDSPFSLSSSVTADNPILGKYYFPQNKSIDRGDCAVTIRKVRYEDVGLWTCGAGLDDGKEHIDNIMLEVEGLYTMSTASATGITFGAIVAAAILSVLGIVVWKKRRFLGSARQEEPAVIEIQELGPRRMSPRLSPQTTRHVPIVTVQSPSDASAISEAL